jgi:hypothetical protein
LQKKIDLNSNDNITHTWLKRTTDKYRKDDILSTGGKGRKQKIKQPQIHYNTLLKKVFNSRMESPISQLSLEMSFKVLTQDFSRIVSKQSYQQEMYGYLRIFLRSHNANV